MFTGLVRDFNLIQFPGRHASIHDAWKRIQRMAGSVSLRAALRGYWVLTSADLLEAAWADAALLSSAESVAYSPAKRCLP